ncbi:MAG: sigma-70 family RNA polymerase sigma factor [Pseudomonadota bacterium]
MRENNAMLHRPDPPGTAAPGGRSGADLNDARLIGLITQQDGLAFDTLYRAYFPRLGRFLGRFTRSVQLIEEVINDTMLVVWQRAHTYDLSAKVSTWIFAIAYRKALKALRVLTEPVEADFDLLAGEPEHEPEVLVNRLELHVIVEHAVDALPLLQRTVVNLTYYHDMAYGEIAVIMDCPVNTVKTRMFHARRRLNNALAGLLEVA